MAHNFHRPNLPYDNKSLANDDRYRVVTRSLNAPPTDVMLDSDFNAIIDICNVLDNDIQNVSRGILPGASDPNNANFFPTTDGQGNISWTPVTNINIPDGSLSGLKFIDSSITADQIQDGTIDSNKMGPNSVGTTNIIDLNITTQKIALLAVTAAQMANKTITLDQIADHTITTTQIALNAGITGTQLAAKTITLDQIADNTLTAAQMANKTITLNQIADHTITAGQIANNTITSTQLSASISALKADQIAANSTTVYTNPAVQQFHPSAAKFWCSFDGNGANGNAPLISSYNVTSVTKTGSGQYTLTLTVPFANSIWVPVFSVNSPNSLTGANMVSQTSSSISFNVRDSSSNLFNSTNICVSGFGLQ